MCGLQYELYDPLRLMRLTTAFQLRVYDKKSMVPCFKRESTNVYMMCADGYTALSLNTSPSAPLLGADANCSDDMLQEMMIETNPITASMNHTDYC